MQRRMILAGLVAALAAGTTTLQAQHRSLRPQSGFMIGAHTVAAFGTSVGVENGGEALRTGLGWASRFPGGRTCCRTRWHQSGAGA